MAATCPWLRLTHAGSLQKLLSRLGVSRKRGRERIHSPDALYWAKLRFVYDRVQEALESEGRLVVVFLDEMTYYRQPVPAPAYELRGSETQPLARRSPRSNTPTRVIAAVDVAEGRVRFWQGAKTDLPRIVEFYRTLREAFPRAERIWAVQDNWPVHFHPDLLCALEEQERPFPFHPAKQWSDEPTPSAKKRWGEWKLPIQIAPLPTYAPWTNPIEKLWRWGRQQVLHLHRLSDQLEALRDEFAGFLDRFADGSTELLRYIGLSAPRSLYASAWNLLPKPSS